MKINKKIFQNIFKVISYSLFKIFYKKIEKIANQKNSNEIRVSNIKKNGNFEYQIYTINKGRLYTDRVNDTAVITKNEINIEIAIINFGLNIYIL